MLLTRTYDYLHENEQAYIPPSILLTILLANQSQIHVWYQIWQIVTYELK